MTSYQKLTAGGKLTQKQVEFLKVVRRYVDDVGRPPSYRELGREMNCSCHNSFIRARGLMAKGFLKMRARTTGRHDYNIELVVPRW